MAVESCESCCRYGFICCLSTLIVQQDFPRRVNTKGLSFSTISLRSISYHLILAGPKAIGEQLKKLSNGRQSDRTGKVTLLNAMSGKHSGNEMIG